MKATHVNFVSGITDTLTLVGATSFSSPGLANMVTLTAANDPVWVVFNPSGVGTAPEIVQLTVHTAAATTATIVRGQQSTVAAQWAIGTTWTAVLTKSDLDDIYERAGTAGDIKSGIWSAAPTGWLLLNGATLTNGQTNYPKLWAVIPASWKSGANILLPNLTDRFLMGGGTLGATGGSNTHVLVTADLPAHTHTITHTHEHPHTHTGPSHTHTFSDTSGGQSVNHTHAISGTTSSSGAAHTHAISGTTSSSGSHAHQGFTTNVVQAGGGAMLTAGGTPTAGNITSTEGAHTHTFSDTSGTGSANHTHTFSDTSGNESTTHTHAISGTTSAAGTGATGGASDATTGGASVGSSGSTGSGSSIDHTPAHLRVNWAIKT